MIQPPMNHKILQMAYVVNDCRKAAERWSEVFGIGPFFILDRPDVEDPIYRGKPQKVEFSVAIAQAGDIHVEMIEQHCDSPSCYRDLFARGDEGFHHKAIIVEEYDTELARYQALGFPVASSGKFGPLRFAYIDTSSVLGGMVEILEDIPFIHNYFGAVREAAETWDGERPIRSADELTA